jgi:hypothetical protein
MIKGVEIKTGAGTNCGKKFKLPIRLLKKSTYCSSLLLLKPILRRGS